MSLFKVAGAVHSFVGSIKNRENSEATNTSQHSTNRKDFALSCNKCNHLSYPIAGTHNRYKCSHCERQFAGARHPF